MTHILLLSPPEEEYREKNYDKTYNDNLYKLQIEREERRRKGERMSGNGKIEERKGRGGGGRGGKGEEGEPEPHSSSVRVGSQLQT